MKMKVKVTQLCLALCDPMDYTVHGILQARILEGGAFFFSSGSSQPRDRTQVKLRVKPRIEPGLNQELDKILRAHLNIYNILN